MPDRRRHRGPHPSDRKLFARNQQPALRQSVADLAWLLGRGYPPDASLKLVGDHHRLTARQRRAVQHATCTDEQRRRRRAHRHTLPEVGDRTLVIDGFNVLITVESAMAGGVCFIGRDGCLRDLASVHGSYRTVEETRTALEAIVQRTITCGATRVRFLLDRPVSNSGRVKTALAEILEAHQAHWAIDLVDDADHRVAAHDGPVATSDSWILDRASNWVPLAHDVVAATVADPWIVDLSDSAHVPPGTGRPSPDSGPRR